MFQEAKRGGGQGLSGIVGLVSIFFYCLRSFVAYYRVMNIHPETIDDCVRALMTSICKEGTNDSLHRVL